MQGQCLCSLISSSCLQRIWSRLYLRFGLPTVEPEQPVRGHKTPLLLFRRTWRRRLLERMGPWMSARQRRMMQDRNFRLAAMRGTALREQIRQHTQLLIMALSVTCGLCRVSTRSLHSR